MIPYTYYRLVESYRDADGRTKQRTVLGLGELEELPEESDRKELAHLLTEMIKEGTCSISERPVVYDTALRLYGKYLEEKAEAQRREDALAAEARARAGRERDMGILVRLKSLQPEHSRSIGAEHLCNQILRRLGLGEFLKSRGWSDRQTAMAMIQVIMRAVHPGSELRTVRCIRENSAVCELFGVDPAGITKDTLYGSARRLYGVRRDLEDYLHNRVCSMFNMDEKIYLFDLTNTYFEGRMENSEICRFGRSKEKRSDCRIVGLGAVVNTDGMLVRTEIFEGNRQDVTTLEEVIGSLGKGVGDKKRVVVIDAGFNSESNIKWLVDNGYDYITVMRPTGVRYTESGNAVEVEDSKHQPIRLRRVEAEGGTGNFLLVDSDAKAAKERGMYDKATQRVEEELARIKKGIEGKGVKNRDKIQQRLGRINSRYHGYLSCYDVEFDYDNKDRATAMRWHRNEETGPNKPQTHGKYLLRTSLDTKDETNVWMFYNVIRTVEETFKTLKTDLDIRPVFHKSDDGTKAHLHLAILAYWVVSTARYILKQKGINVRWSEILRITSAQQRVTMAGNTADGKNVRIRKSTEPEEKLASIQSALGISPKASCPIKFVWPPKIPSEKTNTENQLVDSD